MNYNLKNNSNPDWPIIPVKENFEPYFIFLLSPPYSGSTAISKIFINSTNVSQIHSKAEGQWLIKGLCSKDRWEKNKFINIKSVRSVWTSRCLKAAGCKRVSYFIEKSPPNMMRIELLMSIFPNHLLLSNNRNPYASISSAFYRNNKMPYSELSISNRTDKMMHIAKKWVNRSIILKEQIIKHNIPHLSYEKFCEKPSILQENIDNALFRGAIKLNLMSKLKVKDYEPQLLNNMNNRQIKNLTKTDINIISEILKDHKELLTFFGYGLHKSSIL